MSIIPRLFRRSKAIPLLLFALATVRCSLNDSSDAPETDDTGGGATNPGESDPIKLSFGEPHVRPGSDGLNILCGSGTCVPDDAASCANMGGLGGMLNVTDVGGAAGRVAFDPGDLGLISYACRVSGDDCESGSCRAVRQCLASGRVERGQPCAASTDCQAGLACVGEGAAGVCRPYCCEGTSASCEEGTYCDERPLLNTPGLYVPVCLPVDNCPLTDPYPCGDEDCVCQGNKACIVVRDDGSTACTEPGAGRAGDACSGERADECAHGFVCSPTAGCMQLCSIVATDSTCPKGGTCQKPFLDFPDPLGLCVGLAGESTPTP